MDGCESAEVQLVHIALEGIKIRLGMDLAQVEGCLQGRFSKHVIKEATQLMYEGTAHAYYHTFKPNPVGGYTLTRFGVLGGY